MFKRGINEKLVLNALSNVKDPDLGRDIVTLGFIKDLKIDNGNIKFDLELTTPACPVKDKLKDECVQNLKKLEGIGDVEIKITSRVRQGASYKLENLNGVKNLLAVASGKGGVGKSTVAVNLALALSKAGAKVGIMDADIYGPSLPTMLGVSEKPRVDEQKNMIFPVMKDGISLISMGFLLDPNSPVIWRGPMVSGIIQQFLGQVMWGELDYLVIDLPPGTGDIQLTLTQHAPITGAVIVTTPQDVSVVDARRGLRMFEEVNVPVLGVIENMSYFICDGCEKKHYIFKSGGGAKISEELDVPFLGKIPLETAIANGGDSGRPVVMEDDGSVAVKEYMDIAGKVASSLSIIKEGGSLKKMMASPLEVNRIDDKKFEILWSDGHKSVYNNRTVRLKCPCASCVDEWTGKGLLDEGTIPEDLQYEKADKVGSYALAFSWSDGHNTGLYSYDFLRNMCECDKCTGGEHKCSSTENATTKQKCSSACSC